MLRDVNLPLSPQSRVAQECEVLRVLCGAVSDLTFRDSCFKRLANYRFVEPEHQVVFDALHALPSSDPNALRDRLTVRLNNQGFPDINLAHFFAPSSLPRDAALELVGRLAELGVASSPKAGGTPRSIDGT
jgi:hypothetical protein